MNQSERLREEKYFLDRHDPEEVNVFAKGKRVMVYFVRHNFHPPYFLAELETTFAEAETREGALEKITELLKNQVV